MFSHNIIVTLSNHSKDTITMFYNIGFGNYTLFKISDELNLL